MIKNKKALSNIISTVIIILLSMVAVTVLSASVLNLVKNPSLSPEYSCPTLQFKSLLKIDNTCYNQATGETEVTLKRSLDESLSINNMQFSIDSEIWECGESCGVCNILNPGNTQTYYFETLGSRVEIITNNCVLDVKEIGAC
mgnify:CR=1 FL=1